MTRFHLNFRAKFQELRPRLAQFTAVIEIAIVIGLALWFARPILNFDVNQTLPGSEYQVHVGVVSPFLEAVQRGTGLPLWNSTVGAGRSLIADPFLFIFNPFLSGPMFIWGVVNGSKVALALAFVTAGLGVWSLGRLLEFGWLTRLWCSSLYTFSGALVSHIPIGQIQLVFALAWLPWAIVGTLWVTRSRGYASLALVSLGLALFYFAGNFYYQVYGLACILIMVVLESINWADMLRVKLGVVGRYGLVGAMAVGFMAIQLLPQLAAQSSIHNEGGYSPDETDFANSQPPSESILNYLVADHSFYLTPVLTKAPFLQESYRYVSLGPFLAMLFLVPAFRRGHRKEIVAFGLCLMLMLAWADVRGSFMKEVYRAIPILFQFRWPGRALSVGGLFVILLGGFGLEELWRQIHASVATFTIGWGPTRPVFQARVGTLLAGLVVLGVGINLNDVYLANKTLVYLDTQTTHDWDEVLVWLRQNDPGAYGLSTATNITNLGTLTAYEQHLRFLNVTDGWHPAPVVPQIGNSDALILQPNYWVIHDTQKVSGPQAELIRAENHLQLWRNTEGFPYVFVVPTYKFADPAIEVADVTPASVYRREGPNRIVVETELDKPGVLVLSEAWFEGWQAFVDGQPARLVPVGAVLNVQIWISEEPAVLSFRISLNALQLQPGPHHIVFQYTAPGFVAGVWVTTLTLLLAGGIGLVEWQRSSNFQPPAKRPTSNL